MRVAVTTMLTNGASSAAADPPAAAAAPAPMHPAIKPIAIPARIIRRPSCLYVASGVPFKSGRFLPLMKDLNKFSHNHAFCAARVALLIGGCFASAGAKDAHTTFTVGASVRAVASLEVHSSPSVLNIAARDVVRGYLDVPESTQLSITGNSRGGYALEFLRVAPLFSSMSVRGFESDVVLDAEGGTVVQRWQPGPQHLTLTFRFMLAPGLVPGTYPWPLRLTVRPLEST